MCLLGRIRKTGEEIKSRRQKSDLSRNVVSTWVEGGDVRIGPEGVKRPDHRLLKLQIPEVSWKF